MGEGVEADSADDVLCSGFGVGGVDEALEEVDRGVDGRFAGFATQSTTLVVTRRAFEDQHGRSFGSRLRLGAVAAAHLVLGEESHLVDVGDADNSAALEGSDVDLAGSLEVLLFGGLVSATVGGDVAEVSLCSHLGSVLRHDDGVGVIRRSSASVEVTDGRGSEVPLTASIPVAAPPHSWSIAFQLLLRFFLKCTRIANTAFAYLAALAITRMLTAYILIVND